MSLLSDDIQKIKDLIQSESKRNFTVGVPKIPPHTHNGIDNLKVSGLDITSLPKATPGGSNGDLQVNVSGAFGTIKGLNLDQTGNTRGANALDIQSIRTGVTQVASGDDSTVVGQESTASGKYSLALGWKATASGYGGVAAGYSNTASGAYSVSAGYANTAGGKNSTVVGNHSRTSAGFTTVIGSTNVDSSTGATADNTLVGNNNKSTNSGAYSCILLGNANTVSSAFGTAIGVNNTVSATQAMTIGLSMPTNSTIGSLFIGSYQGVASLLMDGSGNITLRNANANASGTISVLTGTGGNSGSSGNISITPGNVGSFLGTVGNITLQTPISTSVLGGVVTVGRGTGASGLSSRIVFNDDGAGTPLATLLAKGTIFMLTNSGVSAAANAGLFVGAIDGNGNGGQVYLQDRTGDPPTPTGGGVIYCKAGALYFIGSSATITPIAPA